MHLLATTATNLDDIVEAVDLGQPPGDIAILSFADSDLTGLAAAWEAERASLPSIRLAHLRDLRHPMSVDLWIDRVGAHAKVIVVRLLGGLDWWKYGIDAIVGAGARTRHRARRVAGRRPRRRKARRRFDAAGRGARHTAALLPRRRPRKLARAVAAARRPCRLRSQNAGAQARPAARRLFAGRRRASISTGLPLRLIPARPSCRSSSTARCCSRPIRRRLTLSARRWRRAASRRRRLSLPA